MWKMHFKKDASVKFVIYTIKTQKQTASNAKFSICTINVTKGSSFSINQIGCFMHQQTWRESQFFGGGIFARWITLAVAWWRGKSTLQMYLLSLNKHVLVCMCLFTKAAGYWIILVSALSNSLVSYICSSMSLGAFLRNELVQDMAQWYVKWTKWNQWEI